MGIGLLHLLEVLVILPFSILTNKMGLHRPTQRAKEERDLQKSHRQTSHSLFIKSWSLGSPALHFLETQVEGTLPDPL